MPEVLGFVELMRGFEGQRCLMHRGLMGLNLIWSVLVICPEVARFVPLNPRQRHQQLLVHRVGPAQLRVELNLIQHLPNLLLG